MTTRRKKRAIKRRVQADNPMKFVAQSTKAVVGIAALGITTKAIVDVTKNI